MDPALMLPFSLPTSTDMLVKFGAGFGGVNRERERKYLPSVPPEFLAKLDLATTTSSSSAASFTSPGGVGGGFGDGSDITDGGGMRGLRDRNGSLSSSFERVRFDDDNNDGDDDHGLSDGTKNGFR